MTENREKQLYTYLENLNISFEKHEHEAFPTCEASGTYYTEKNMGKDCKSIFMRNRKGKKHYLIVLPANKKIDVLFLAEFLEEHPKMSFASDERLEKYLGLKAGSVTPFSLLHENAKEVIVVFDSDIFSEETIHFHPLRNTATLHLSTLDFKQYVESLEQKIKFICF
ncbi:TPA: prolyl-tRNA synthetase associated domain-containing protein [Candidatus Peregrinibacteria bacterium]|nr:prolyl-tRNA synthetase associated domain-containing protein [Candidatus Peregrinibacteria bacterium]HIQ57279.1 prolyl-tRNA synthetase associated domain-containing protein [Candidatus Gracilibacteria bacterium]